MGRALRTDVGDYIYHVLNRANASAQIFDNDKDYQLFEQILVEAKEKCDMRLLACCIMPNHWHLVVYPKKDGDLSKFMNCLTLTHTQRWHANKKTTGQGHLYQGRYKSFLCQDDDHFLSLIRYIERNALRANLVNRAEEWKWGSAYYREYGTPKQKKLFTSWPVQKPNDYLVWLNQPQTEDEGNVILKSIKKGSPYGSSSWRKKVIKKFNLEITLNPIGRPKKGS